MSHDAAKPLPLSRQRRLIRGLCLVALAFYLSGCGFVLAPIETVTVGVFRTVLKEYDTQVGRTEATETPGPQDNSVRAKPNDDGQSESPLIPAPGQPSKNAGNQITRLSLMPPS